MNNAAAAIAALADPTRRQILERLSERPQSVSGIAAQMPVSRPAVSQHLKVLREAELVTVRAAGTQRIYHIDPKGLAAIREWLDRHWDRALAGFQQAVEKGEGQ